MPPTPSATPSPRATTPDFDRHVRRGIWIAALCTMIGAAIVYAGKAADERSAFIRWRHQVLEFVDGTNIYDKYFFPNPPLMPISLVPFMMLPPVAGAVAWFTLKVVLAAIAAWICMRMVKPPEVSAGEEFRSWLRNTGNLARRAVNPRAAIPPAEVPADPIPSWVQASILLLAFRPILSDLHHGNNNILIMFLVVASLAAWRRGYDVVAGLILALSITYKVTPGLFVLYFAYKRSWRTVGATMAGMALFLFVVPSLFLGIDFNLVCLRSWWNRILSPYVTSGVAGVQEINQSMIGVVTRILTTQTGDDRYSVQLQHLNLLSLSPRYVVLALKGVSVGLLGLLAWACRTRTERRDDPRLLGEFSLIVLAMLFASERSWKHHFVTLLLPITYLAFRAFDRRISGRSRSLIGLSLALSGLLMATTSSEFGGLFAGGQGHKIAQFYGMFLWAGVTLFVATAWRVRAEAEAPLGSAPTPQRHLPSPHARPSRTRPFEESATGG